MSTLPRLKMPVLAAIPLLAVLAGNGCGPGAACRAREASFAMRSFEPQGGDRWIGDAVCYGPHRDGQRPGGPAPSAAQISEDLRLMAPHWRLLRLYGSSELAETILAAIRADGLGLKVMLGVWIDPGDTAANRRETDAAIRLAEAYSELVLAVCVGNETQVSWSPHPCPLPLLLDHVRRVREGVGVPVTVADDFSFWNEPRSRTLAAEIDFITMHAHPLWNGRQLNEALPWLRRQTDAVRALHPGRAVVLGETGWATSACGQGEQARLIKGRPGEAEQKQFFAAVRAWARAEGMTVFFFEAFDENWKGGPHPDEVEKHWGLFRADRSPKAALAPGTAAP